MVDRKSQKTDKLESETARSTTATQTAINIEAGIETAKTTTTTQTDSHTETTIVEKVIWISRLDPSVCLQEGIKPNVEPRHS